MDKIKDITSLLLGLTSGALAVRLISLFIITMVNGDEENANKHRIKNALIFFAIALTLSGVQAVLKKYFK